MAFDPDRTLAQMLPWTREGKQWRATRETRAAVVAQQSADRRQTFDLERKIVRNERIAQKHHTALENLAQRGAPREQLRVQASIMVACDLMVRRLRAVHAMVQRREMNAQLTQSVVEFKRSEKEHDRLLGAVTRELLQQPGIKAQWVRERQSAMIDLLLSNAVEKSAEQMEQVDPEDGDGALLDALDSAAGVNRTAAAAKESVQGAVERAIDIALLSVKQKLPPTPPNTAHNTESESEQMPAMVDANEDAEYKELRKRFVKFRTPDADAGAAAAVAPPMTVPEIVVAPPAAPAPLPAAVPANAARATVRASQLDERLRELRREQDARADVTGVPFSLDDDDAGSAGE